MGDEEAPWIVAAPPGKYATGPYGDLGSELYTREEMKVNWAG
eukprot:gene50874-26677_t